MEGEKQDETTTREYDVGCGAIIVVAIICFTLIMIFGR